MLKAIREWNFRRNFCAADEVDACKSQLEGLSVELSLLRYELEKEQVSPLHLLVLFFRIVAAFQDRRVLEPRLQNFQRARQGRTHLAQDFRDLHEQIAQCGRGEYLMNRSQYGEKVDFHNVYLGERWGRSEFDISVQEVLEKDNAAFRRLMDGVARDYVSSHVCWMLTLVEEILLTRQEIQAA
jgi:hypothetical protein